MYLWALIFAIVAILCFFISAIGWVPAAGEPRRAWATPNLVAVGLLFATLAWVAQLLQWGGLTGH